MDRIYLAQKSVINSLLSDLSVMTSSQDNKVASCLKDLPQRLQTPSLNVRKNIFHDLTDLFTTTDLPESIVKVNFVIQDTVAVVSLIPWCNFRECARC